MFVAAMPVFTGMAMVQDVGRAAVVEVADSFDQAQPLIEAASQGSPAMWTLSGILNKRLTIAIPLMMVAGIMCVLLIDLAIHTFG